MPMDEPTPGELMRAIQEIKNNQTQHQARVESLFRDQSLELAQNYVRVDLYSERSKAFGERLGAVENGQAGLERHQVETKDWVRDEFKHRDEEAKKTRQLVWTSLGAPLLILLIGVGLKLVGGV